MLSVGNSLKLLLLIATVTTVANGQAIDICKYEEAGRYGLRESSGAIISKANFDVIMGYREGLAPVRSGEKWGYIDKSAKLIIPLGFDDARDFSRGWPPFGSTKSGDT